MNATQAASEIPSPPAAARRIGALLALGSLLLAGCEQPATVEAGPAPAEHVTPVRVAAVLPSEAVRELRLPGVLRAVERVEPAFLQPGHLAERSVARGEQVRAGQRLASLQNPALAPALAAAQARVRELDERLVQLDAELERARELHARELVSADTLERALAQRNATRQAREQALAAVAEARDQLDDAVLRAPFDATVSELLVEPGDFVAAGQPVLVLAGGRGLEVELQLPESVSARVSQGDSVALRAVATGAGATGQVREIGLARDSHPATAVIALEPGTSWQPGTSVHATLRLAAIPALSVPMSAIIDPGTGQTRVFKVENGRARQVTVDAGRLVGARVEVSGALAAGDLVVIAGHQQLLDGEAVRVLP